MIPGCSNHGTSAAVPPRIRFAQVLELLEAFVVLAPAQPTAGSDTHTRRREKHGLGTTQPRTQGLKDSRTNRSIRRRTKSAYGLQWNRFRIIRTEEDRATFRQPDAVRPRGPRRQGHTGRRLRDGPLPEDRGRILGDSWIVGVDLSRAVRGRARHDSGSSPRLGHPGDLLRLPFAPGTFDRIYSLGVIDHTPDPRAAFLSLARLLKPGGRIAIWVYPRERAIVEWIMNAQRAISTRMPLGVLEPLCRISAPIGGLKRRLMSQPAVADPAAGRGRPPGDHRRLDASGPGGPGVRHPRLVRAEVLDPPYRRGGCGLVRRGRTDPRGGPESGPGLLPRRSGAWDQSGRVPAAEPRVALTAARRRSDLSSRPPSVRATSSTCALRLILRMGCGERNPEDRVRADELAAVRIEDQEIRGVHALGIGRADGEEPLGIGRDGLVGRS